MLTPASSNALIFFGVPDMLLFSDEYYRALTKSLKDNPDALTVRFVVSSITRQVKHTSHNPPLDDSDCNICVIDIPTALSQTHRHGKAQHRTLVEQVTEALLNQLKDSITLH